MRSIRGGTLGWNIEIYSTPTNQFDWSVSRAYVIDIYVCVYDQKKNRLNDTLAVNIPFQTLTVYFSLNYRLALQLRAPEMLSSLSKSSISLFMCTLLYLSEG